MFFADGAAFRAVRRKAVTLFGMSGVGKTRLSTLLRESGWHHYSADHRIGAHYLREAINEDLKRQVMALRRLRPLLMTDSIRVAANITFDDLSALSAWLGKPGDPEKAGLPFAEYLHRQRQHRSAEIGAMMDVESLIVPVREVYGYDHVVVDASGSLCEVVEPEAPNDAVLQSLARVGALLYIRGDESHEEELARRFARAPKPMYYEENFLKAKWAEFKAEAGVEDAAVDPDEFIRWGFRQLLRRRIPRYQAIADRWGYQVEAEEVAALRDEQDFSDLMAVAIDRRLAREKQD
ncbi:hypothetical protein [Neomegalonema perideroedes]|uniref:hypothetical protein n=1 Tax=Neomegalonema perideroedes TaxID=217219 RepID=UPI00035ECE5F|nr:hypothetical protein [Neomegalonema perideroedes]